MNHRLRNNMSDKWNNSWRCWCSWLRKSWLCSWAWSFELVVLKIFRKFTPIKLIATFFSSRFIGLMLLADCLIHSLLMSIPTDLIHAFFLFADFATDSSFFHTENICSLLCNF